MPPSMLRLGRDQLDQIIEHLKRVWPEEGCGFIAGVSGVGQAVFPISNDLRSETEFRMNPRQQVHALHRIRDAGMQVVGIFHSHPHGPAQLSPKDVEGAVFPDAAYLVLWPEGSNWKMKAHSVMGDQFVPIKVVFDG